MLVVRNVAVIASIAGLTSPQVLVPALPVVQPRALAPAAVVDGQVQQPQVGGPGLAGRALEALDPDAAPLRFPLAAAVRADAAAGAVAQFLRAAHRAHVTGDGQRALAAHPAAEQGVLSEPFGRREQRTDQAG